MVGVPDEQWGEAVAAVIVTHAGRPVVAEDLPGPGTVYLGQTLQFKAPVYPGDTLTVTLEVKTARADKPIATLVPQRRVYNISRSPMTEVAIDRSLTRDLYVALGEPVGDKAWGVRVHHKPLVNWIWLGCLRRRPGAVGGAAAARPGAPGGSRPAARGRPGRWPAAAGRPSAASSPAA